jgi:hypothetical protein
MKDERFEFSGALPRVVHFPAVYVTRRGAPQRKQGAVALGIPAFIERRAYASFDNE